MNLQVSLWLFLLFIVQPNRGQFKPAQPCDPDKCLPPNCRCSEDRRPPGGLTPEKTPQIIMVTFDDDYEKEYFDLYNELLDELHNPNNCPAVGTLFVCHNYTDYFLVETAYSRGYEISDHTVTHQEPTTYWENADYTEWKNEIDGQKEILHRFANVPYDKIVGFRAPYLMFTENMFKALNTSKFGKFTYDLSWPSNIIFDGKGPIYPYTLDYLSSQNCPSEEEPCPKLSYQGLWEVPNVNLMNKDHSTCGSMMDACDPDGNATVWLEILTRNFHYHYDTNRAPFGMHMHPSFFLRPPTTDHMKAAKQFLKYALDLGDVWILTPSQIIAWMKDPQDVDKAKTFAPWQCPSRPKPRCTEATSNNCHYTEPQDFYMRTCTECPPHFPSPTDPDGN